ncbi:hypothetical protein PHYBOEH_007741 [Phytophthora boehmeriae]|uniref:Uncharacterized protein n=1 Tax=Phytophthora boehmeriae TaxID=109152 RepID=A0A8T1X8T9_9STRA|nr:hypothetical protein PHYBOEH_007741 [Phytophthora boehmeriae]
MHVKPSFFRSRQAPKKVSVASWTSDHVEQSGKSSLGVLLDWMATPSNYTRWRSSGRSVESRRIVADEIVQLLHSAGLVHRTAAQVVAKVAELERSYQEAAERLASTKRELEAAQGTPAERNLHRVLERHCRYFALLQPIMKDTTVDPQPKKRPLLSTKRKSNRVQQPPVAPVTVAALPPPAPVRASARLNTPSRSPSPVRPKSRYQLRERPRSPSPPAKTYQLRERRVVEPISDDISWDFAGGSPASIKSPPTPPTPLTPPTVTARRQRKTKTRVMESISVMQLEEEHEEHRIGAVRDLVRPSALRSVQEIDLEKARVELTLRQLEVQIARDKALVMRAKARSELLEQGVSRDEVDRLMPLDV